MEVKNIKIKEFSNLQIVNKNYSQKQGYSKNDVDGINIMNL